jgi:protein disulfide-isomerase
MGAGCHYAPLRPVISYSDDERELMPRDPRFAVGVLASFLLIGSAAAQQPGVRWQNDIETAKATAQQTGRLVLVHVWTENCGPCAALEQNVFSQPGFGTALEQKFVPVKLNANEYPGTAQGFGITRVPTDVVLSPDGQVLAKMISPATPSAYLADLGQVANQYASQSGIAYQQVAAAARSSNVANQAYAGLQIAAPFQPPTSQSPVAQQQFGQPPVAQQSAAQQPSFSAPAVDPSNPYNAVAAEANKRYAMAGMPTPSMTAAGETSTPLATPAQPPAATSPYGADNPYSPQAQSTAAAMPNSAASTSSTPPSMPPTMPPASYTNQYATEPQVSAPAAPMMPGGSAASSPAVPDLRELPAGAPPLAFEGYCPVTMRTSWQWVEGDPKWGAIHRGRTYWFAGPREQQQFLANPDYYSPALAGLDPVMAIDHRQSIQGVRQHSLDFDNQFYFFSSEATLAQFTANPRHYANGVRQAMGLPPVGAPQIR